MMVLAGAAGVGAARRHRVRAARLNKAAALAVVKARLDRANAAGDHAAVERLVAERFALLKAGR